MFPVIRDINAFKGLSPKDGPPYCLTDHVENSDWCLFGFAFPLLNVKNWGSSLHVFVYNVPPSVLSHFQSCLTLCDPMDCNLPGFSVCGILKTRILEWVAMPSFRGTSQPRNWTCSSCASFIAGGFFTTEPPGNLIPPYTFPYISFPAFLHITSHSNQARHLRCDFSLSKADDHFGRERIVAYSSTKTHNPIPHKKVLQKRVSSKLTSRKRGQIKNYWLECFKKKRFIDFSQVLKISAARWMTPANPSSDWSGFTE